MYFDAAVFLANLLIVPPLLDLVKDTRGYHSLFAFLMIMAVVFHAVGAYLKRKPLQVRLARQSAFGGNAYLLFLVLGVMHLGLFMACTDFAFSVLEYPERTRMILMFTLGLAPTILTLRAMIQPWRQPVDEAKKLQRTEYMADSLLFLSMIVILIWWEGVFVEVVAGAGQGNWFMSALLVILMSVPFAMFYLAPRMLFLVEDYRNKLTWLSILVVMMPMAWRLVHG